MRQGFVQLNRGERTEQLMAKHRNAFVLLSQIALRARFSDEESLEGLTFGQALIGDWARLGFTEGEYRAAKKRLEALGIATFKGVPNSRTGERGTVATLTDFSVFELRNRAESDGQNDRQNKRGKRDRATGRRRTHDRQATGKQQADDRQTTANQHVQNGQNVQNEEKTHKEQNASKPMTAPDGAAGAVFDEEKAEEALTNLRPDLRPESIQTAVRRTAEDRAKGKRITDPMRYALATAERIDDDTNSKYGR